ncbi:hypothetical protein AAEX28_08955 [Lentisphaerota bacterium WC36G]|nr:hypothetical protein LJT99_11805 [Lentisphaerae bacterium WC36]
MKTDLLSKDKYFFDNIMAQWCFNFIWFIASCAILFKNMQKNNLNDEPFIFLIALIVIVLFGGLNAFNESRFRSYINMFFDCVNILLLPLILYSFGLSIEWSLFLGYINIVIVIALSPKNQLVCNCSAALLLALMVSFGSYFETPEVYDEVKANIKYNDANSKIKDMHSEAYKVENPMTLQEISAQEDIYGNSNYWYAIYKANTDAIKNPTDVIAKNTVLNIPKIRGISYNMKLLTIEKDSSLQEISSSKDTYANIEHWKLILDANASKIDNEKKIVPAGTTLIIPVLPPSKQKFFIRLSLIFVTAVALALIWKFTIGKIYKMLNVAYSVESKDAFKKIDNFEHQVSNLDEEVQLLKHELAMGIMKMRHKVENNDL